MVIPCWLFAIAGPLPSRLTVPPGCCWVQDDLSDVRHRLAAGTQQPASAAPPLPPPVAKGNMIDVFGNVVPPIALDQVACPSCGRKVAAGRFAPHLEKCMGRGRQASRNANKRLSAMEM